MTDSDHRDRRVLVGQRPSLKPIKPRSLLVAQTILLSKMSHPLRSFPSEVVDSVIKHRPSSEVVSSTIRRDLPPEMIDYIIDHLAVTRKKKTYRDALMNCCLVSKSWVPRCRKHLFREIRLDTIKRLRAWKETFPVPAQSPDHFVCTLVVGSMRIPQEYVHRIQSLTGVVKLRMLNCLDHEFESNDPLFPFPVLSLVKSLHVCCDFLRSSEFLNLIHSFPLLVDLRITQFGEMDGAARADFWSHAPPPPLTGTLWLRWQGNRGVPLLIDLPGGLRFRKIVLAADKHSEEEVELLATLVERCLGTLECIDIDFLGVGE